MSEIKNADLEKIIADTVFENMKLNPELFIEDLVKDLLPIQLTVGSTIRVLQKLGFIKITISLFLLTTLLIFPLSFDTFAI